MIRKLYHILKRHRATSALLKSFDFIRKKKLKEHAFPLYIRTISNHWVSSSYENDIRSTFKRVCQKHSLRNFYDVGANVGIFSADFLSLHPNNVAYAFEPNPSVFECLLQTKEKNALSNLILHQVALSNECGTATLQFDPLSPAKGGLHPIREGKFNHELEYNGLTDSVSVKSTTLDAFISSPPFPDIMKIDAEGEEFEILSGGKTFFKTCRPILFFECTKNSAEVKKLLSTHHYRLVDCHFNSLDLILPFNIAIPESL